MLTMADGTAERMALVLRQMRPKDTTQEQLGAILGGETQSWVSRRESGEVEATPSEIARFETAYGVPPGTIYRLAGLIQESGDIPARAAIAHDPLLTREHRRVLLATYDASLAAIREREGAESDVNGSAQ